MFEIEFAESARGAPAPAGGAVRELRWAFLGRVPYGEAMALQEALRQALRDATRGRAAARGGARALHTAGGAGAERPEGGQAEGGAGTEMDVGAESAGESGAAGAAGGRVVEARTATRQLDREGAGVEHLLLLEHPHVYTLGRNASVADVLASSDWLAARGIEVVESDRGGQVTYHGPGQLVGYPVLDLHPDRRDVRRYVRDLEEVLIRTLAGYGIAAEVRPGPALIGVWVGNEKIAAIGVHLSRWITTHGFALNVATDLSLYAGIVPCGLREERVTSMARRLGAAPPLGEVAASLAVHFAAVFGRRLAAAAALPLPASPAAAPSQPASTAPAPAPS
jgi:lipoyl(octanoyl) transferase